MARKKPKAWDGDSRMCTSPYPVKKGGCLGEVDYGQGIQYDLPGAAKHRYCIPCHFRRCREEDDEWSEKREKTLKAKNSTQVAPTTSSPSESTPKTKIEETLSSAQGGSP